MGIDAFADSVTTEWGLIKDSATDLSEPEYRRIADYFAPPDLAAASPVPLVLAQAMRHDAGFARWVRQNGLPHRLPGHANAVVSLKSAGRPPGDASASEMEAIAGLADDHGTSEIRVTYQQNIIIPHVRRDALPALYEDARAAGLGGGENGLVGDIIACPGLDYCNLANARSLPLADRIFRRFGDPQRRAAIGRLQVNISGCINACGHHHAADIGILGVDKKGVEHYQITIGGRAGEAAAIGRIIGPSFAEDEVPAVIETIIDS
ncbi:MAG: nitrite/sulfite reductase, partial [Rhodobiaceae bacterium]